MKLKQNRSSITQDAVKYFSVYLISLKETLYYPQKLRSTAIMVPFRILIILTVYRYAFDYLGKSINGINADIAIWSIAIYHILLFTQFRGIFNTISSEIRRGHLETQLNKPYDYLIYKFWEHLGKGLPNLIISLITVIPLLYIFTGGLPSSFNFTTIYGALSLIIGGTLVSAMLYILIVLPALWIDDAQPFFWIVDKSIMVLGGAFIPIALLPQSFQTIANLTPFGAPMFVTQMFNPDFPQNWFLLFAVQVFWIIVLLLAISIIFNKAQLKLSINGG